MPSSPSTRVVGDQHQAAGGLVRRDRVARRRTAPPWRLAEFDPFRGGARRPRGTIWSSNRFRSSPFRRRRVVRDHSAGRGAREIRVGARGGRGRAARLRSAPVASVFARVSRRDRGSGRARRGSLAADDMASAGARFESARASGDRAAARAAVEDIVSDAKDPASEPRSRLRGRRLHRRRAAARRARRAGAMPPTRPRPRTRSWSRSRPCARAAERAPVTRSRAEARARSRAATPGGARARAPGARRARGPVRDRVSGLRVVRIRDGKSEPKSLARLGVAAGDASRATSSREAASRRDDVEGSFPEALRP